MLKLYAYSNSRILLINLQMFSFTLILICEINWFSFEKNIIVWSLCGHLSQKATKNPLFMRVCLPMAEDMRRDLKGSHSFPIHINARISPHSFPILPTAFTLYGHLCGHDFEQ